MTRKSQSEKRTNGLVKTFLLSCFHYRIRLSGRDYSPRRPHIRATERGPTGVVGKRYIQTYEVASTSMVLSQSRTRTNEHENRSAMDGLVVLLLRVWGRTFFV